MASGNKGQQQNENAYKAASDQALLDAKAATAKAAEPDPLEARRRARVLAIDKWQSGESGPIDVRNMPGNDVNMALFNDSLKVHDAGRVGGGMGTMGESVNPNFTAALDKEHEMTRHLAASGALEGSVDNALAQNNAELTGLYQIGDQRNMNIAGMENNAYQAAANRDLQYKLRPKQPNFFRQLAMQFAQGAGTGAVGLAGG